MSSIISASAQGATFLILLQLSSRALTFAVNQILLRFLSLELLGISAQFELVSNSVFYFSRDILRVALQRETEGTQSVVNLSYLSVFTGIPLTSILLSFWLSDSLKSLLPLWLLAEVPAVPFFSESLKLCGLAAIVELMAEPGFAAAQQKLLYKTRASAESIATFLRCFGTCAAAIWAWRVGVDVGALPFAIGQMSYAVALLGTYTICLWSISSRENFSLLPRRIPESNSSKYYFFSPSIWSLALSLTLQSSLKFILTEGDKLLMAKLSSLRDQGAYALASNYGGLIARILFQPIEESSRNLFAKLCSQEKIPSVQLQKEELNADRSIPDTVNKRQDIAQASTILTALLKLYSLISCVAVSAGPALAPLLLRLVAGSKFANTSADVVLATYCYYIPLLAYNGVTEAFVAAVATESELHVQSLWMMGFFVVFAGTASLFLGVLGLGASGVVGANCVNMGLRVLWSLGFITRYFRRRGVNFNWASALPSTASMSLTIGFISVGRLNVQLLPPFLPQGLLGEFARQGVAAVCFGLLLLYFERNFLLHCSSLLQSASQAKIR